MWPCYVCTCTVVTWGSVIFEETVPVTEKWHDAACGRGGGNVPSQESPCSLNRHTTPEAQHRAQCTALHARSSQPLGTADREEPARQAWAKHHVRLGVRAGTVGRGQKLGQELGSVSVLWWAFQMPREMPGDPWEVMFLP